eukprot:2231061-Pyramimonas_sp.AAC.1
MYPVWSSATPPGKKATGAGRQNPNSRRERGKHPGQTIAPSKSGCVHLGHSQTNFLEANKHSRLSLRLQNLVPK